MIKSADNETFRECKNIYTISKITTDRLKKYNDFNSEVLTPPVNNPELFIGGELGNYIFAGGRINNMKRQHLLIEAMTKSKGNFKLLVAGPSDTPAHAKHLHQLINKYGLVDRVILDLRYLSRQEYADCINRAAAVACIPFDEDMGYIPMEAAVARKAVITTNDSGGVLNLVKHLQTGWIAEPNSESLALAMDSVFNNLTLTKKYGELARELWCSLEVNWQNVTAKLLQ
jgi:glycosyltransferase involved in cell wall biosynthesis